MKKLITLLLAGLTLISCKTEMLTKYRVRTDPRNYYADELTLGKDSVKGVEKSRRGSLIKPFAIKLTSVRGIDEKP